MSLEEFKARSKEMWGTGDYGPTGRQLAPVSEGLVESLAVSARQRALDVAAGDGNCAMALARRTASVVACDFSPVMVASGRKRTEEAGLDIEWHEADASALPFEDESFDAVTSVFGMIFAAEQETAASEALRVLRPGGTLGLTAWADGGFTSQMIAATRDYGPPPPEDAPDPLRWGDPEHVRAVFRDLGQTADVRRRAVPLRYESWAAARESLEAHGMMVMARRAMPPEQYEEQFGVIRDLMEEFDPSEGDEIRIDSAYLEVLVTKA